MPPTHTKSTSKVWSYFIKGEDGQFARCLLCKNHLAAGKIALHIKVSAGYIQIMRNHMRMNHKKEFIEMENEEEDKKKQNNLLK